MWIKIALESQIKIKNLYFAKNLIYNDWNIIMTNFFKKNMGWPVSFKEKSLVVEKFTWLTK